MRRCFLALVLRKAPCAVLLTDIGRPSVAPGQGSFNRRCTVTLLFLLSSVGLDTGQVTAGGPLLAGSTALPVSLTTTGSPRTWCYNIWQVDVLPGD